MSLFKDLLYNRLSKQPHPLFIFNDTVIPAATIWVGVRAWSNYFRKLGLEKGDRVILCYPESPAFIQILFASIWEELTLIIIKPTNWNYSLLEELDAKFAISIENAEHCIFPNEMGLPQAEVVLRKSIKEIFPEIRFILQSSGSTGKPKFVCLTEKGVFSVIQSHSKVFESKNQIVLSVLPWSHCFGLVLDLLLATVNADSMIRDPDNGKKLESIFLISEKYEINHLSGVPLIFERILEHPKGNQLIQSLQSGIIGGAPISTQLAEKLNNTNLFVGYGQTEASPGICLGDKRKFFPNYLGKAIGCEVKVSDDGELLFKGENSYFGYWQNGLINKHNPENWVATGDLVQEIKNELFFLGRRDFAFKLPNGIMVYPEIIEDYLKSKIKNLTNCMVFYKEGLHLLFSVSDTLKNENFIQTIRNSIHPILKNYPMDIKPFPLSDWILSPKGGVDRKLMLEKINNSLD